MTGPHDRPTLDDVMETEEHATRDRTPRQGIPTPTTRSWSTAPSWSARPSAPTMRTPRAPRSTPRPTDRVATSH